MGSARPLPATHIAVQRIGTVVVSSFVFDDGLAEAAGVGIVMTSASVRGLLELVESLASKSEVLARPAALELPAPSCSRYTPSQSPANVHAVSVMIAEDSEVVVVGFRCVNLEKTLAAQADDGRVAIQTTLGPFIAVCGALFLKWVQVLGEHITPDGAVDRPT